MTHQCGASRREQILTAHGWGSREHGESYAADDGICLLPEGHAGPHAWTPEGEMMIEVVPPVQSADKEPT